MRSGQLGLVEHIRRQQEVYPEGSRRAVLHSQGYDTIEIEEIVNEPVNLEDMARWKAMSDQGHNGIEYHTRLSDHINNTQSLPFLSRKEALQEGAPHKTVSGRLIDIDIAREKQGLGMAKAAEGIDVVSIVNISEANGDIARQVLSATTEKGTYDPYKDMTGAFLVLEIDPDAPNPKEAEGDLRYAGLGDFRVVDVLTTNDPNPTAMYTHTMKQRYDGEGANRVPREEWDPRCGLLHEQSTNFEAQLRKKLNNNDEAFNRVVDGFIASFGRMFREGDGQKRDKLKIPQRDPKYAKDVEELFHNYMVQMQESGMFKAARIPLRAYTRYLEMQDHVDKRGNNAKGIETQKDRIRREVIEAIGIADELYQQIDSSKRAASRLGKMIHPMRYSVDVLDELDREIAMSLMEANNPDTVRSAKPYAKDIPRDAELFMAATPENKLILLTSKNGPRGQAPYYVYNGNGVAYDGSKGSFPENGKDRGTMANSIYDAEVEDYEMPGIAARVSCYGPMISPDDAEKSAREYVYIDLLRAPGKLLIQLAQMGVFTNPKQGIPDNLHLGPLLNAVDTNPQLAVTTHRRGSSSKHPLQYHSLLPNETAAQIVLKEDGDIAVNRRGLAEYNKLHSGRAAKKAGQIALTKGHKASYKGVMVPVQDPSKKDESGIKVLIRTGVHNNALYAQYPAQKSGNGVSTDITVMQSDRPKAKSVPVLTERKALV